MIKAIITDFSRVLLFPSDPSYSSGLNALNNSLLADNPHYRFLDYFTLNSELLAYYAELHKQTPVYVFTSETIQDHPAIKDTVASTTSKVLSASKLGIHKSEPAAYKAVLDILFLQPDEVVYIDDKQENLEVANQIGINTILFRDNPTTISTLNDMLTGHSDNL